MAPQALTLPEAADALGVHYMTAYRYVRQGRLAARRDGGEWRIRPSDLVAFTAPRRRETARRGHAEPTRYRRRLIDRMLAGDEAGAWAICERAIASGMEPAAIYVDVLGPALEAIGDRWARGVVDVADEHRATAVATRIVGRCSPRFVRRGRPAGRVILGGAPEDIHALPVALAADLLRGAGFTVLDLGANVPAQSFATSVRDGGPLDAVCVTIPTDAARAGAAAATRAIRRVRRDVPVYIGGRGADATVAQTTRADGWARSGAEAVALVQRRPRR